MIQNQYLEVIYKILSKATVLRIALIILPIAIIIGYYNYSSTINNHITLKDRGIITNAKSNFREEKFNYAYADYSFITNKNKIVSASEKCMRYDTFEKEYKNLKIIYDPTQPNNYMKFQDFENYSYELQIFYYLIFFPVFASFFIGGVLKLLIQSNTNKENLYR